MARDPHYFKGKTVLITGAGSGLGRAAAVIFARERANVISADIDPANGEETARLVNEAGGRAIFKRTDVTCRSEVEAAVAAGCATYGRIHFLFNSAGAAMGRSAFLDIGDDLFDRTFDLNVKGTFYGMQAVLPHMLAEGGGVIVNVASMAHKRGGPGTSVHYAASKGAVHTMTMGVAREFAGRGVRVLSVSPGPIDTPFQSGTSSSQRRAELRQSRLTKRLGSFMPESSSRFADAFGHGFRFWSGCILRLGWAVWPTTGRDQRTSDASNRPAASAASRRIFMRPVLYWPFRCLPGSCAGGDIPDGGRWRANPS